MPIVDPALPFGVAWTSSRLYRVTADHGTWGRAVEVDGWDDALDEAWRRIAAQPGVRRWVADYLARRGDEGLGVVFGDTTRVVGRRGYGNFSVSYPAEILVAGTDQESAMRAAILVALDRHVDRRGLGVPLLSSVVDGDGRVSTSRARP